MDYAYYLRSYYLFVFKVCDVSTYEWKMLIENHWIEKDDIGSKFFHNSYYIIFFSSHFFAPKSLIQPHIPFSLSHHHCNHYEQRLWKFLLFFFVFYFLFLLSLFIFLEMRKWKEIRKADDEKRVHLGCSYVNVNLFNEVFFKSIWKYYSSI